MPVLTLFGGIWRPKWLTMAIGMAVLTGCTQAVVIQSNMQSLEETQRICNDVMKSPVPADGCANGNQIWFPNNDWCIAGHEVRHVYEGEWHTNKRYNCAYLKEE